jgi:uncharacterized protein YbjQ (UPF0145 family)
MILATTDVIQGAIVEAHLGVVTAEVVYGSNAIRDFFAGIRAKYRTKVVKLVRTGFDAHPYSETLFSDSQSHTERYS